MENLNTPYLLKIGFRVKNFHFQRKLGAPDGFPGKFYQTLKE